MALARVEGAAKGATNYALAWIDISTGAFRVVRNRAGAACRGHLARRSERAGRRRHAVFHEPDLQDALLTLARPRAPSPQPASCFDSAAATAARAVFRRRARWTASALSRAPNCRRSPVPSAYVEKTQMAERPPLSRPDRGRMRRDAVHRPGDARQSGAGAHDVGRAATARSSRRIDRTVTGAGSRLLARRS